MCFNSQANNKLKDFLRDHDIGTEDVYETIRFLFDADSYAEALPVVESCWEKILRDPCSRTNSALVRKSSIDYFRESRFLSAADD